MNIEIANRLVELRRAHGFSQEELAHRLGLSRQAVSKWERAEASPDTDNLIALSRLYGVSLDELLLIAPPTAEAGDAEPARADEEKLLPQAVEIALQHGGANTALLQRKLHVSFHRAKQLIEEMECRGVIGPEESEQDHMRPLLITREQWAEMGGSEPAPACAADTEVHLPHKKGHIDWSGIHIHDGEDEVHIGWKGIHVKDAEDEVHVGWKGVHVKGKEDEVHVSRDGVHVDEGGEGGTHLHMGPEEMAAWGRAQKHRVLAEFPIWLIVTLAFLALGFAGGWWHPAWLLFLLIPLYHSAVDAVVKRDPHRFAYPVLTAGGFLALGFFGGWWHPAWLIFLTIPLYYWITAFFRKK